MPIVLLACAAGPSHFSGGAGTVMASAVVATASDGGRPCPALTEGLRSDSSRNEVLQVFENHSPLALQLHWLDFDGAERLSGELGAFQIMRQNTMVGHAFRAYYEKDGAKTLVLEHVVSGKRSGPETTVAVSLCDDLANEAGAKATLDGGREAEFQALAHDPQRPCEPLGQSSLWSCVRHVTKEELAQRPAELYGFSDQREAQNRPVGETHDRFYVKHIPSMPRVTDGPGFLKMSITKGMIASILDWYNANVEIHKEDHGVITGGYTNNHVVLLSKLSLDKFPEIRQVIVDEMRYVLQWWTKLQLKHTDTFGVRIYHRESMLINHVDRDQTHIASAVIQLGQEVDEDGGWPIEVISEEGEVYEVYLQPGEMVLYEGGKLKHGRPMRLRGENFSNVFSHFAPLDWYGPSHKIGRAHV